MVVHGNVTVQNNDFELARVEREWVMETGILNFTSTMFKIE